MLQPWLILSPSQALCHRWTLGLVSTSFTCNKQSLPYTGFLDIPRIHRLKPLQLQPLLWHHSQQSSSVCSILEKAPPPEVEIPTVSSKDLLSEEQLRAVETRDTCVRVVAGPGSGKTRVLTHRVAHLISGCGVPSDDILFVTFTNKAAQELRERLEQLFVSQVAKQLTVGTFHSICAKILRWHPCFGIDKNFVIYDENDSEKVLRSILKAAQNALNQENDEVRVAEELKMSVFHGDNTENKFSGHFHDLEKLGFLTKGTSENVLLRTCLASREKSEDKGQRKTAAVPSAALKSLLQFIRTARLHRMTCFLAKKTQKTAPNLPIRLKQAHLTMATLYEKALRRNNAVDFDDLIHLVVQLLHTDQDFREVCQERWKYILVDEFQDTDKVQYELIRLLASKNQNLFVVGDIDQAIFGWRGAEFSHMQKALEKDFPSISTFQLRENYRSSSCIVKAASVILKYSHYDRRIGSLQALSPVPVKGYKAVPIGVGEFENPNLEASFIVSEIQKLVRQGEAIWGSFALLYRTRVQSFQLEASLVKAQIPYQILGSTPFYSIKEVKTLIAYLQLIANPENEIALEYCLNTPPRGIGDRSVDKVKHWANLNNLSFPRALERIYAESVTHKELGLRPNARNGIFNFMEVIHQLREMSLKSSVIQLLRTVIQKLQFETYIEGLSHDEASFKQHMERIQQLLASADIAASLYGVGDKALLCFLEDVTLLANHEERHSVTGKNQVKLLTLHSSKGLEFDCVFLVGASDSLIPLEDCDLDEERRLFYVGVTRARKRLYLTHSWNPPPWHNSKTEKISRFVRELLQVLPQHYYHLYSTYSKPPPSRFTDYGSVFE